MLPSMPLLMTPAREGEDSSDTSDDSPSPHPPQPVEHFEPEVLIFEKTTEAAPEAQQPLSTINHEGSTNAVDKVIDKPSTPEKRSLSEPTSAQKKKKMSQHRKMLAALTPDTGPSLENSSHNFAEAYFQKVKNRLDDEKWKQFVQELVEFEAKAQCEQRPVELYRRVEGLLAPHGDLVDEFLAFLRPHQALELDRFMPYLVLVKMKDFFRKLNILLMKKQTQQVMAAMEMLAGKPGVTLAEVKQSILPLLKSSPLLTNHFLELLPGERPPDSLMTDFEEVDMKDDSLFETIIVPDGPDPYGNETCICLCHNLQKMRHCVRCGIKYVNGRVYLQYGKALRPAKVTFKDDKLLDLRKLEDDKVRSRRKFLPKSLHSPNYLDHRQNADSEDDCGNKKSPRTPRIRVNKSKSCKKAANGSKEEVLDGIFPLTDSKHITIDGHVCELIEDCEIKDGANDEHEFDEVVLENDCNTEEDEEEELNKCLQDENESSTEADDVCKELESGIDCSFEDEEVEDMEIGDDIPHDINKSLDPHEAVNQDENIPAEDISVSQGEKNSEVDMLAPLDETNAAIHILLTQCENNADMDGVLTQFEYINNTEVHIKLTESETDDCCNSGEGQTVFVKVENADTSEVLDSQDCGPLSEGEPESNDNQSKHDSNGINNIQEDEDTLPNPMLSSNDKSLNLAVEIKEEKDENEVINLAVEIKEEKDENEMINLAVEIKEENDENEMTEPSVSYEVGSEGTSDSNINTKKSSADVIDSSSKEWTREEDKIILQTFQLESGLEQTFDSASLQLPNRSKEEIQQRFEVLLNLLKERYLPPEPDSKV